MLQKKCIIIAGPTAIGKTDRAIKVAQKLNTEIISADSRQCFGEMKIGVARPTDHELSLVKHHFIANHSVTEKISAASFEAEAIEKLNEIFSKNDYAVVCGGTGLYINALMYGLDSIPEIEDKIHQYVLDLFKHNGIESLRKELLLLDPDFSKKGDVHNPNRMMRALEVVMQTGRSLQSFQTGDFKKRNFECNLEVMELPREILYDRINHRVDLMIEAGLENEVRSLIPYKHLTALQTVGYTEFFDFFEGKISRDEAVQKIKQHTRNYAKRQITWFKKMQAVRT